MSVRKARQMLSVAIAVALLPGVALGTTTNDVGIQHIGTNATAVRSHGRNNRAQVPQRPGLGGASRNSADRKSKPEPETLGTIVVTADKRVRNILDVPGSIGSISSGELKALNAFSINDLGGYFADVGFLGGHTTSKEVTIRGVGSSTAIIGVSNRVGVYIDGVYVGQTANINQDLLGISRVQVLRGPQGTMFGANTIAGAVDIITKRPSHMFTGHVALRAGNMGLQQEIAEFSGPLVKGVYGSLAVGHIKNDGYVENPFGERFGNENRRSFRGQLEVTGVKNLDIYATIDGIQGDARADPGRAISNPTGTAPNPISLGYYGASNNDIRPNPRTTFGSSLQIAYHFPNGDTLKSITAYRFLHFGQFGDADYSPLDILDNAYNYRYKQYTQEFQLLSPTDQRFRYVLGAFYYRQNASSNRAAFGGANAALLGLSPGDGSYNRGTVGTTNLALYGNATYQIAPRWTLRAGLRASFERKAAFYDIDSSSVPAFQLATGVFRNSIVTNNLNPLVTLTYKVNKNTRVYGKYATGYRAGGFNMDFIAASVFPDHITIGPEQAKDYEVGLKTRLWDGRANLSIDAFRENFLGYQLERYEQTHSGNVHSSTLAVLTNAGSVVTQGLELSGRVLAAPGLTINGSFAYDNAYFSNYPDADPQGSNYRGRRLTNAPRFTGSLGLSYSRQIGQSYLGSFAMRYSYMSRVYDNVANETGSIELGGVEVPFGYVAGRGILDASATLSPLGDKWEVSIWARNLTNKHYLAGTHIDFLGTDVVNTQAPRAFGATLTVNFGAGG